MAKRLFGTDGIRGVAGESPLDARTVYAAGLALAEQLETGANVLIAMDTRESGPWIAETFAGGLAAGGARSTFVGVLPTAGVSFLTQTGEFAAGAMISASHNPFADNGIKVFGESGLKLPDEVESVIEDAILARLLKGVEPHEVPLDVRPDVAEAYFTHLTQASDVQIAPLKIEVDCANGAASPYARRLFEALGVEAEIFSDQPDGRNINLECGSLHLDKLRERVAGAGADLGVAFDGDADRALFVAGDGEIVDGDGVLLLAAKFLKERGKLTGDLVVTTIMANMGLEKALEAAGIRMTRTQVGDKYVLEEMLRSGAALGGEQSGHVIFRDFANTGDGLLTARRMLEVVSAAGRPLSELRKQLEVFPQKLVNVRVREKPPIQDCEALAYAVEQSELAMAGNGRVVVRYSGTEPVARVMVEAADMAAVEEHCGKIAAAFEAELGVR